MNVLDTMLAGADSYVLGAGAVLMRLLGLLLGTPLGTNSAVPARVRALLLLHLTLVMFWALGFPTIEASPGVGQILVVLAPELLLGLAMGLLVRLTISLSIGMGQMASYSMGLGFANFVDPATGLNSTVVSRTLKITALLVFFAADAHLHLISAVYDTFQSSPPGTIGMRSVSGMEIVLAGADFFAISLRLAAPILATGLMIYVVLAVMTRVAPQMNLFAFGFALTIPAGLTMLAVTMPSYIALLTDQLAELPDQIRLLAGG